MLRRNYIDALDGQMHVTQVGTGRPIILLPWYPRSALMYKDELEVFASLGYQAIALDPMGWGQSFTKNTPLSVVRHADNVAAVISAMGLHAPVIVGGHYSSAIATELVSRETISAATLVIDGGILITDDVSEEILEKMARVKTALTPEDDGSHRQFLWSNAVNIYDIYAPGYEVTTETLPKIYQHMFDYLAAFIQQGCKGLPVSSYEDFSFSEKLASLHLPCVFLSAPTETLASALQPMIDIHQGPHLTHMFDGDHPLHFPSRAGEYARAICDSLSAYGIE